MSAHPIIGLGEILWDLLPGGRQLGGAPFNFAFHCHQLGHPSVMVSRVGADALGEDIRAQLHQLGLADTHVQTDAQRPTGTVTVALDAEGKPAFTITPNVAWDNLTWNDELEALIRQARAVCFGTLVQRSDLARRTVARALQTAQQALVIFDVNLRQHFYSREIIETSLHASRWVKLNEDELIVLRELLGLNHADVSSVLSELRNRYALDLACLTLGERGCLVQTAQQEVTVPGQRVTVVDTVGSGDAFTAGLLVGTLEGYPLAQAAAFANRLAGMVASHAGGTPRIERREVEEASGGSGSGRVDSSGTE